MAKGLTRLLDALRAQVSAGQLRLSFQRALDAVGERLEVDEDLVVTVRGEPSEAVERHGLLRLQATLAGFLASLALREGLDEALRAMDLAWLTPPSA